MEGNEFLLDQENIDMLQKKEIKLRRRRRRSIEINVDNRRRRLRSITVVSTVQGACGLPEGEQGAVCP